MPAERRPAALSDTLTWAQTRALIRSDLDRLMDFLQQPDSLARRLYTCLQPGFQALFWHRIARCLYLNGWPQSAHGVALIGLYLARANIPPTTSLGPAALIGHATCVHIHARVGARLSIYGDGGFMCEPGGPDIGAGPGCAVAGDDVVVANGARVYGAVRLGHRVRLGPRSLAMQDVPDGGMVAALPSRVVRSSGAAPVASTVTAPASTPATAPAPGGHTDASGEDAA
jgi:serine O-acetyltransferase